jgi:SWI/SNF-related matrix-associated actin-dependent regulator of chromatin subfamily A3
MGLCVFLIKLGFCAHNVFRGKTLTMIALILATRKDPSPGFSNSTLIGVTKFPAPCASAESFSVVPLSILSNWEKQIQDHCTPNTLSYCIYYGAGRSMSANEIQAYDVVITTYQTVVQEDPEASKPATQGKKKKTDNTLFQVKWKRIILDEGHQIRNPKTKMASAVSSLVGERRMILTGTPIVREVFTFVIRSQISWNID